MALPQSNAYKGGSYGSKISTPRLDNRGANLQQQYVAKMNDKRLREQFDTKIDEMHRKEILQMQKDQAISAATMYQKVGKVTDGGETYQTAANNYWNNQINEVAKIKQGMNKLPGEEGYIDPVIGARMITNIDASINKYATGVNQAAAEAIMIDDALKNPIGEEGSLSITNKNLPQAKLLQDWKNGVGGINLESNDQGQTLLTRDNVVFNIDAYVDAQDDEVDMFLKVPQYKDALISTATVQLGGEEGENYSSDYYDYKTEKDGSMVLGTLVPKEDKLKELANNLAIKDKTIIRMANDPIYGKVYWKDVVGRKEEWKGTDAQKLELQKDLAALSIKIARERNGTPTSRFTDAKIFAPKGGNKGPKNKPNKINKGTVTTGYQPWINKNLVFNEIEASTSTEVDDITGLPKKITVSERSKNIDKVKKKLLEIYPNTMMTGANFLKQNPNGVGNQYQVALDATNVNPEDLIIKYLPNEDTQTVRYEKIDISDQKLRDENTVNALLNDPRGLTEGKAGIL
jgi:hypothetical protein